VQLLTQLSGMLLAAFIERQIGSPGVPIGAGPDRIAVPREIQFG
jgi:hypothetical protein